MKWISNLKIRGKMICGFLVVAIIAGLIEVPAGEAEAPAPTENGQVAAPAGGGGEMTEEEARDELTRRYLCGETLRQTQRQAFNTWRWSMGYCRGPMGF